MTTLGFVAPGARLKVAQPGERRVGGLAPGTRVVFEFDGRDADGVLPSVGHPAESASTDD
jgi:hypothetical protein